MNYCINPESDEPIFTLFDQIGKDEDKPFDAFIDGNLFARELLYMDGEGKKRIQIWINSEGGSVKDGYSIISAILKTKTRVDVLVMGIAYSIAGVIALMGKKVEAMDYATLMYHNPFNPDGTKDEGLEVIKKSLVIAVASRTGKSEDEVIKIFDATTFYTAEKAKKEGFVDVIISAGDVNAPKTNDSKEAKQKYAVSYLNKFKNPKNKEMTPEEIKAHIADGIAAGIAALEAKNKKKKDEDEDEDEDKKKMKKTLAEAEDKIKAYEADEKARQKAEDEDKKTKAKAQAKAKIESVLKTKNLSIEEKVVNNYVEMAGETEEGLNKVVETIEAIPTTKTAAKMTFTSEVDAKLGIPSLKSAGANPDGTPIAGDTKEVVNAINAFDFKAYNKRKKF